MTWSDAARRASAEARRRKTGAKKQAAFEQRRNATEQRIAAARAAKRPTKTYLGIKYTPIRNRGMSMTGIKRTPRNTNP